MTTQKRIETECSSCGGTGLYSGFAEPKGVAVVCLGCSGTGCAIVEYVPFTGRKERRGIQTVRRSSGAFLPGAVGPTGRAISYERFKAGEMP